MSPCQLSFSNSAPCLLWICGPKSRPCSKDCASLNLIYCIATRNRKHDLHQASLNRHAFACKKTAIFVPVINFTNFHIISFYLFTSRYKTSKTKRSIKFFRISGVFGKKFDPHGAYFRNAYQMGRNIWIVTLAIAAVAGGRKLAAASGHPRGSEVME